MSDAPLVLEDKAIGWRDGCEGAFVGLSSDLYHRSKGVSRSMLEQMTPPSRLVSYLTEPRKREAWQIIGTLTHHRLLTPSEPMPQLAIKPAKILEDGKMVDWHGNRKVCKQWVIDREAEGKIVMSQEELDTVNGCVESLACNRDIEVREMLSGIFTTGQSEVSCFREFLINGEKHLLRCRPDWVPSGVDFLCDVKTTMKLGTNDEALEKLIYQYRYQSPFYLRVFNAATGESRVDFKFIVCEKAPPYLVRVCRVRGDSYAMKLGEAEYIQKLSDYARCVASGNWPGHPAREVDVDFKDWRVRKLEKGDE